MKYFNDIKEIQEVVTEVTGISKECILGLMRSREVTLARHLIIYVYCFCGVKFPVVKLAKYFNQHWSTIGWAREQIRAKLSINEEFTSIPYALIMEKLNTNDHQFIEQYQSIKTEYENIYSHAV